MFLCFSLASLAMSAAVAAAGPHSSQDGLRTFFRGKVDELEMTVRLRQQNLRRLQAQRNELNQRGARRVQARGIYCRTVCAVGPRGRARSAHERPRPQFGHFAMSWHCCRSRAPTSARWSR